LLSALLGAGILPRAVLLTAGFIVLGLQADSIWMLAAYCWLFWVIRCAPTQALFSAVHGKLPERSDWITKLVPSCYEGYEYGMVAGAIRTLPALPAMLIIGNPFLVVFFAIGVFYYIGGYVARELGLGDAGMTKSVRFVEIFIAALFGLFI